MNTIQLPHGIWQYDPTKLLGKPGGFGAVYEGTSNQGEPVAIKLISVDGHREIDVADDLLNKDFAHVIPVYDAGQDTGSGTNFLVMARAEKSLQDVINYQGKLDENDTVSILLQIVDGLLEVPNLVHRDLKPANILFHSGSWKIADFGIAKFVEESTSLQTLKDCLTPPYGAPEQWNLEKTTNAVDIYALGCIAFTLITGGPPFSGSIEEVKNQHLQQKPPIERISNPRIQTIASMMLRKKPETRPSTERVKELLLAFQKDTGGSQSSGLAAIAVAGARIAEQQSQEEARKQAEKDAQERRQGLAQEAQGILAQIIEDLFCKIQTQAPLAIITTLTKPPHSFQFFPNHSIKLGNAEMQFDFNKFAVIPVGSFRSSRWEVITGVIASIEQKAGKPYKWGANLWYTNRGEGTELRWWEICYMHNPLMRTHPEIEPYSVSELGIADRAASPGIMEVQFGARPKLIDDECSAGFQERWLDLFAKATTGQLSHPGRLPLD